MRERRLAELLVHFLLDAHGGDYQCTMGVVVSGCPFSMPHMDEAVYAIQITDDLILGELNVVHPTGFLWRRRKRTVVDMCSLKVKASEFGAIVTQLTEDVCWPPQGRQKNPFARAYDATVPWMCRVRNGIFEVISTRECTKDLRPYMFATSFEKAVQVSLLGLPGEDKPDVQRLRHWPDAKLPQV